MELIIRNTTNQPIYDQIYAQIKAQILAVGVEPLHFQHLVCAAERHLHIRVDLDA